jgi:putative membrane protein
MNQQSNYDPSRRWALIPLLVAAGLISTFVGIWLYRGAPAAPPTNTVYPWFWWFPFGWFIFIPIFFLIFFAVRWYFWGGWWWGRGGWYHGSYDPALETLRQRYANGDISKEQYDRMKRDLEQSGLTSAR